MSTTGTSIPALISAFAFGIVVNAASAALFLFVSIHGAAIFRDGQRLVLATFLLSAVLWAQIFFISIAIDASALGSCQVGVVFDSIFDQLARFSLEQYLLWAIGSTAKAGPVQMVLQGLLAVRFIIGAIFVGFSRGIFDPVCVPHSSMLPLPILVVALDAIIIAALSVRAFSAGLVKEVRAGRSGAGRSKSILLVIAGFAVWTATSVAMLIGSRSLALLLRTLLPSIGLLVLVFIVTACSESLTTAKPRVSGPQQTDGNRDINTGESVSSDNTADYPPSRFEDLKRGEAMGGNAFERPREAPQPGFPAGRRSMSGSMPGRASTRTSARVSRSVVISGPLGQSTVNEMPPPVPSLPANLVPPMRSFTDPPLGSPRVGPPKAKRSLRDLRGGPGGGRSGGVRFAISNPILEANGDQNPLNKIATISLEDAVRNERDRRANNLEESALIASRSAPSPPDLSPEEGVQRAVSLKRKEVASVSSATISSVPGSSNNNNLEPMPTAVTSSAQLSPAPEDVRRRSPRPKPADSDMTNQSAAVASRMSTNLSPTVPLPPPAQMPRQAAPRAPRPPQPPQPPRQTMAQPRSMPLQMNAFHDAPPPRPVQDSGVRRPDIRPSRQAVEPANTSPEPTKTPLQRRPTNGLPGNPRAMAKKEAGAAGQRQQTIMFMNNIVYDNPDTVKMIIDGVSMKGNDQRSSIVNRPRPIPRMPAEDRAIFPAEPSPLVVGHRRSKSGSSLVVRKSLLGMHPGSPTQLPPLPKPPKSMAALMRDRYNADRPHPNDTKSMTFDEKMTLLFPTTPVTAEATVRRRSSVPDVPPPPLDYVPTAVSPVNLVSHMSKSTSPSARTSARTENILAVDEHESHAESRQQSLVDDAAASWFAADMGMPAPPFADGVGRTDTPGKRASSPVLPPPMRDSSMTANSNPYDDFTTNRGSVYSAVVAVPIQAKRQAARSTYIGGVTVPIMLSTDSPPPSDEDEKAKQLSEKDEMNNTATNSSSNSNNNEMASQWHRRVGDDCPTFSDRKEKVRSRKMPPPTPLLLGPSSTRNPIIVKAAEPSPLESPEQALAHIRAQLKNFEEPDAGLVDTPNQRMTLIANLEKEMDMQQGHWNEMKHDIGRDSISTTQSTSPRAESRRQSMLSNRNSSQHATGSEEAGESLGSQTASSRSSIAAERRSARRERLRSSRPIVEENTDAMEPATPPIVADDWQQRLADAEAEFDQDASHTKSLFNMADLGSPTPPDSRDSDVEHDLGESRNIDMTMEAAMEAAEILAPAVAASQPLWTPSDAAALSPPSTMLWVPAPRTPHESIASTPSILPSPRAPSIRSLGSKRNSENVLPIETSTLWGQEAEAEAETVEDSTEQPPRSSLWKPQIRRSSTVPPAPKQPEAEPVQPETEEPVQEPEMNLETVEPKHEQAASQKAPRPLTQRPPRRSRRVTMLPDILESPEPLPDKRDTLGIFQFPWGERSDTATFQPRNISTFMAMPGTMTSGGRGSLNPISAALDARAEQLEADEYSSSFFDDYDEEDELDNEANRSDDDMSDSDDGFDENTLWEIASLLKSEQVPSKMSLLPPPHRGSFVVDDYITDMPSDDDEQDDEDVVADIAEIIVGLEEEDMNRETISELWASRMAERAAAKRRPSIADPDASTWRSYDNIDPAATIRSKPRPSLPAHAESTELWSHEKETAAAAAAAAGKQSSDLWSAPVTKAAREESKPPKQRKALWAPRQKPSAAAVKAVKAMLFDKDAAAAAKLEAAITRSTDEEPVASQAPRTPRALKHARLAKLTSSSLWAPAGKHTGQLWMPMPKPLIKTEKHLFDRDVAAIEKMRAPIRTTDKEPAAQHMPRTPKLLKHASLPKLTSTKLWAPAQKAVAGKLWAPMPQPKPTVQAKGQLFDRDAAAAQKLLAPTRTTDKEPAALNMPRTPKTPKHTPLPKLLSSTMWSSPKSARQLWTPMPKPVIQAKEQLFDRDVAAVERMRAAVRTTDKEPAAINMVRVPRSLTHLPALPLRSSRLWSAAAVSAAEDYSWILARPPVLEIDDTIPASNVGVKQPTWWEKRKAAEGMQPKPDPAAAQREAEALIDAVRMATPSPTVPTMPIPKQHKAPIEASRADWNAALEDAMAASYPRNMSRISATSAEWQSALSEAVAKSYASPTQRNVEDVAHPVFFTGHSEQEQEQAWPIDDSMMARVAALEQEREFASKSARQSMRYVDPSPVQFGEPAQPVEPVPVQYGEPVPTTAMEEARAEAEFQMPQLQEAAPIFEEAPEVLVPQVLVPEVQARSEERPLSIAESLQSQEQMSPEDAAYYAHIVAMENMALARLQALEGGR